MAVLLELLRHQHLALVQALRVRRICRYYAPRTGTHNELPRLHFIKVPSLATNRARYASSGPRTLLLPRQRRADLNVAGVLLVCCSLKLLLLLVISAPAAASSAPAGFGFGAAPAFGASSGAAAFGAASSAAGERALRAGREARQRTNAPQTCSAFSPSR